jgi:autotransporter-associated beta strand protein
MISCLNIAPLSQSSLSCLRWLLKQTQNRQPRSGLYISRAADHFLPVRHYPYRAPRASGFKALTLAVTLGVSFFFTNSTAWANGCSGDTVINTNVTATQANSSQLCSFTVTGSGSISTNGLGINNLGTITTLNNSGTISTGGDGIENRGTITTLNNSGTISGPSGPVSEYGINNRGTITTLNNSRMISGYFGINNDNTNSNVTITTLNNSNSGTISGTAYGIFNGAQFSVYGATITTLNNNGTITGPIGIVNFGTITTLNNSGTISGNYGIDNLGIITTLNNQQGKLGSNPLFIVSLLPINYNIIIGSAANYGQLTSTPNQLIGNTNTVFGVSSLSTTSSSILNTPFASVLSGIPSARLTAFGSLSGISNGYTFVLSETASGSGIWNLLITACSVCSSGSTPDSSSGGSTVSTISSGTSVGLASLGASPVLSGGTVVLLSGDSSSTSFSITSGSTIQSSTSGSAKLSGVFSGAGGLTFTGTGSTIMSGANTYSGGTTVSGGTLEVAGSSPTGTGDVFVASAGTLMGTGTIAGNSIVSGVLKPGNSPGYLSFTQSLTLNSGSTYQQDIAGATQASSSTPVGASGYYSFVTVGSQLTITSGATLTPRLSNLFSSSEAGYGSSIYLPVLGDKFRIITAGGITGRFTTLIQPAELSSGTQLIAFYNVNNSNSLDLATVPTSYSTTLNSSTTNAKSVVGALDQLLGVNKAGTASSAQDSLLYAVAGQTAANLPTFAQALAGEIHAASVATLAQTPQRVQQSVLARLGDYPMAPSQINPALNNALLTGGISATNTSGLPTASMSTNPAVNPSAVNVTSAAVADGRAWGEIAYQRAERASNSAGNGFNSNLYQIVIGVDAYSNAELGLKLGGGIALSNTTVSANGGNSTIQQGSLFVYGKMPVLQDYVLDGMASVGMSSTNLSRNDPTGYTGGFSSKAVLGNDGLVSVGLSRGFEYTALRVTPYARLSYQYVGQNSYDEGSGAAALNIARFSGSAVRGVIGVAAGSLNKTPLKDDYTYRANLAVGADTSGLLNPTLNTTLGGYSSSVTTATAGSAFVQVGLYGTVKIADNAYVYAGVSGEARSGQTLYGGSVGLRMAF